MVCTLLAFWVSAISGGGASLILIPVLSAFVPASLVPFAMTLGTFSSSASRIAVFRRHIRWSVFFWFVPFAIPAVLLGAWLIKYINPIYLQLVVALFLIGNLPQLFSAKNKLTQDEKPYPHYVLAIVGALAGFVSGITGAIGLLFNRFYLKYGLTKEQIIATRAANEIFMHMIKLGIYISLGLYSGTALWLGVAVAAATVLSSLTVKYILPYMSEALFRRIGYGAMVVSGFALMISTSAQIITQDHVSLRSVGLKDESEIMVHWRESSFSLEYGLDDGLEAEVSIGPEELPASLQPTYAHMLAQYDQVLLEKVYKPGAEVSYEFYAYAGNTLHKSEYHADGSPL